MTDRPLLPGRARRDPGVSTVQTIAAAGVPVDVRPAPPRSEVWRRLRPADARLGARGIAPAAREGVAGPTRVARAAPPRAPADVIRPARPDVLTRGRDRVDEAMRAHPDRRLEEDPR